MTYLNYQELLSDLSHSSRLQDDRSMIDIEMRRGRYNHHLPYNYIRKVRKVWIERIETKYEQTKSANTPLGRFLRKFPLPLKELKCLLSLVSKDEVNWYDEDEDDEDTFKIHKVRYECSELRKHKLVFKIQKPLKPMRVYYEVSYKAKLALKNRKYTEEYQQLDMALEERAKTTLDSLDSLYYAVKPKTSFRQLVLPEKTLDSIKAALARENNKELILSDWGLKKSMEYGHGTTLNFRGPPGTGKTMAAHCVARELGRKLLIVRYDQLQSCWVGETEKHIQRVFKLAKVKNAVLFFDEADAIALDRANLEKSWEMSQVNTLLKELERFDGICIFATNFAEKYDKAFERRLTMHIDFALPDKKQSRQILDKILPKKSRQKGLSFTGLQLEGLSGGDIKNIALNAAGFAVRDNSKKIGKTHLVEAIEQAKKGKFVNDKKDVRYIS